MDRNKLEELRSLDYKIKPACGMCRHGTFPKDEWCTCQKHTYDHLKHSGAKRHLSVYKHGSCKSGFELDKARNFLGAYEEFLV